MDELEKLIRYRETTLELLRKFHQQKREIDNDIEKAFKLLDEIEIEIKKLEVI